MITPLQAGGACTTLFSHAAWRSQAGTVALIDLRLR